MLNCVLLVVVRMLSVWMMLCSIYVESPQLCLDYFNIVQPCDLFSLGYHRYYNYVTRNYAYQLIQHFRPLAI